ncbi:MAG: glycosyltransferase, partial [Bacteroidota bacterium]
NLPNVLIESISCGIPAITFDIGGCGEIIKDNKNGFVVPPFDKDLFASRVVELLTNDSLRKNFSVAAREHAEEHYSLLTTAEKYHSLYRELNMSGENQGVVTKMSN